MLGFVDQSHVGKSAKICIIRVLKIASRSGAKRLDVF